MAYKMKGSPLNQLGNPASIIGGLAGQTNPQSQNIFAGSMSGYMGNLAAQANVQQATQPTAAQTPTLTTNVNPASNPRVRYNMVKPGRTVANPQTTVVTPPSTVVNNPSTVNMTQSNSSRNIPAGARISNPSSITPTPINPKAVGSAETVKNVYGVATPGTFTREVKGNEAPIMQLANPELLQDGPLMPPQGVDTSITPALGFENN